MTDAKELKPCPFCGGDAELDTMRGYRAMADGRVENEAAIYCTKCAADMSVCYRDVPDLPHEAVVQMVVDAWNLRAARFVSRLSF